MIDFKQQIPEIKKALEHSLDIISLIECTPHGYGVTAKFVLGVDSAKAVDVIKTLKRDMGANVSVQLATNCLSMPHKNIRRGSAVELLITERNFAKFSECMRSLNPSNASQPAMF